MGELKNRYIALIGAYCAGIFYLSSISDPPDPGISLPLMDKLVHMVLYGGLAATVSIGIRRSNETVKPWVQWWVPIVFAVAYGVTDELHQVFVPNRGWQLSDLVADALGAVVAQVILVRGVWRAPNSG